MNIFKVPGEVFDFTYSSVGAGRQSSALWVLSLKGLLDIPKPDVGIFADTGDEPQWVYDYLELLIKFAKPYGVPLEIVSKGRLSNWVIDKQKNGERFVSVPVFTINGQVQGQLRRQCTREFKIEPITKKVRELMGYKPRQRIKKSAQSIQGISYDEMQRMKPSRDKWMSNRYPLVENGINARQCHDILIDEGFPNPKRSACVYCPYHSDHYWLDLKTNHSTEWDKAVAFDEAVRDMSMRDLTDPAYVHRSCKPLKDVSFRHITHQEVLFEPDFINECEGMCGV